MNQPEGRSGATCLRSVLRLEGGSTGTARPPREDVIESEELAAALAAAVLEKKGRDVEILDLRGLVSYTDIFVLATATNRRQVQAIADEVRKRGKELDQTLVGTEGLEAARWVLVDFADVVVHIFDEPMRGFYDLDGLWKDAKRLPVPTVTVAPTPDDDEPLYTLP